MANEYVTNLQWDCPYWALVFDLATAAFINKREDALLVDHRLESLAQPFNVELVGLDHRYSLTHPLGCYPVFVLKAEQHWG